MFERIKLCWMKTEDVSIVEWLLLSVLLLFCFFTMYYPDIMIILEEGLELLDCTFAGQFSDFYNYTPLHGNYRIVSVYGILPYLIFAVWGLPVWIINKIIPIDYFSIPVLLWFKLLLVVFLILTIYAMIKIGNELEFSKGYIRWMIYTFLTSFILVLPVFEIAQIDIICVSFITWGLFFYLRGNMKLFTLFFIIAIPLKLFAVFIFIPLILLKEKRLLVILKYLIIGYIPSALIQIPFSINQEVGIAKSAFNFDMFNRLLEYKIFSDAWDRSASAFVVCYGLLCVCAYITNKKEKREFNNYAIYISMVTFLILFSLLAECHPYWIVFLSPFLILTVFNNPQFLKVNILLELGFALTFVCERMYVFWGVFGGSTTFDYLVIRKFGRRNIGERIPMKYLLDKFYYEDFRAAILGVFFVCIIAFVILNFPGKLNNKLKEVKIERGLMWLRYGILAFYVVMELLIVIFDFGTLYW